MRYRAAQGAHSPHVSYESRDALMSRHSSAPKRNPDLTLLTPALWLTSSPSCFLAGGMKEIALHTNRQYMRGLVGCISHFTLSTDYHIALVEDAADGKNINTCGAK